MREIYKNVQVVARLPTSTEDRTVPTFPRRQITNYHCNYVTMYNGPEVFSRFSVVMTLTMVMMMSIKCAHKLNIGSSSVYHLTQLYLPNSNGIPQILTSFNTILELGVGVI